MTRFLCRLSGHRLGRHPLILFNPLRLVGRVARRDLGGMSVRQNAPHGVVSVD